MSTSRGDTEPPFYPHRSAHPLRAQSAGKWSMRESRNDLTLKGLARILRGHMDGTAARFAEVGNQFAELRDQFAGEWGRCALGVLGHQSLGLGPEACRDEVEVGEGRGADRFGAERADNQRISLWTKDKCINMRGRPALWAGGSRILLTAPWGAASPKGPSFFREADQDRQETPAGPARAYAP
jgi:hypothetical protein